MPTTIPAESAENVPSSGRIVALSSGVITVIAKKPYTMVGMPAKTSRTGLTMLRARMLANSLIHTAARMPIGTAIARAIAAIISVLSTSGMMPNANGLMEADHRVPVKKSSGETSAKKRSASTASTAMMPTVVTMPTAAAARSANSIARSAGRDRGNVMKPISPFPCAVILLPWNSSRAQGPLDPWARWRREPPVLSAYLSAASSVALAALRSASFNPMYPTAAESSFVFSRKKRKKAATSGRASASTDG